MLPFTIKRGDTDPELRVALEDTTTDLTGATVRFSLASKEGAPLIHLAPAVIVTPLPGVVGYRWRLGDTRAPGDYDGEFEITFPDGRVTTRPAEGFVPVIITQDAGWRPAAAPAGTVTHVRGTDTREPLVLTDDAGQPHDLTGAIVTVHVRVGGACVPLVADLPAPLLGEAWPDWEVLDLPPRVYRCTLGVTWPGGRIENSGDRFALHVKGAC